MLDRPLRAERAMMLVFKKRTHCAYCGVILEENGTCVSCPQGIRQAQSKRSSTDKIDRSCRWNDHGNICGVVGSMSESTNGEGPWYCSDHFWRLKGYAQKTGSHHVSFRERWYQERKLPYEPAKLEDAGNMRCVADSASALLARMQSGEVGVRMREPGEDDE